MRLAVAVGVLALLGAIAGCGGTARPPEAPPGLAPAPGQQEPAPGQPVPAPRILHVDIEPKVPDQGGWRALPPGPGEVTVRVDAEHADRVRVSLVPSGTATREAAQGIGEDADGGDGWAVRWRYPNDDFMAHLLVEAFGPGGKAEDASIAVYHERR